MISVLAQATVQSLIGFGLVWGLIRCLPRLSPNIRCWMWRLGMLRALIALLWVAPIALLAPEQASLVEAPSFEALPIRLGVTHRAVLPDEASPRDWIGVIWTCGILLFAGVGLLASRARTSRIRRDMRPDPASQVELDALRTEAGLRLRPRVWRSEEVDGPAAFGLIRPVIVLPSRFEGDRLELRACLSHELAHHLRRDLWWQGFYAFLSAMFWFLPLGATVIRKVREEAEMDCDLWSVRASGISLAGYGRLLLGFAMNRSSLGVAQMAARTRNSLEKRLMQMAVPNRYRWTLWAGAIAVPAILAVLIPARVTARAAELDPGTTLKQYVEVVVYRPEAMEELGLSADQKSKLSEFAQSAYLRTRKLGQEMADQAAALGSAKERVELETRTKKEIEIEWADKVWDLLTPDQRQRATGLACQFHGPLMARTAEIAGELGLSSGERQAIEGLNKGFRRVYVELQQAQFRELRDVSPYGRSTPKQELTAEQNEEMAAIQRKLYTATGQQQKELRERQLALYKSLYRANIEQPGETEMGRYKEVMREANKKLNLQVQEQFRVFSKKALEVMTEAQRGAWDKLQGEKVSFGPKFEVNGP